METCNLDGGGRISRDVWSEIRYFTREEFNHPDKLEVCALIQLDSMRHEEGLRRDIIITINEDFALTGHSEKSRHKFGDAFDLVIRLRKTRKSLPVVIQFQIALRYNWTGIGFYPFWTDPGLHVDTRPMTRFMRRALWWRDEAGKYHNIESYFRRLIDGGQTP